MTSHARSQLFPFAKVLQKGIIVARPNRFIMLVRLTSPESATDSTDAPVRCHCPVTGRIGAFEGSLAFSDLHPIPCLLSPSSGAATRSTQFTVEAIQIAQNGPWVGINQTAANRYVESFLRAGLLPDIVPPEMVPKLRREVAVGKSRLDFSLGEDMYIEVKTMVLNMPCQDHPAFTPLKHAYKLDGARLRKHYAEVTQHMVSSTAEAAAAHTRRSAVILCHLWDAPSFNPSRAPSYAGVKEVVQAARLALSAGVEHWQVNVEIVPEGYRLLRCFRLDLQHVLEAVHDSHASVECDV